MRNLARTLFTLVTVTVTATGIGCTDLDDPDAPDLGTEAQELHGPLVAPSGPLATMLVRFHDSPGARGSSTLIRQDMVLTNRHVVEWTGAGNIYVQVGDAPPIEVAPYQVIAKWQSPTADLAILQLACGFHPADVTAVPLSVSGKDAVKASSVTLSGYGPTSWSGTDFGVKRQGTIALPSPAFSWGSTQWSTSGVIGSAPGDSGGSLYWNFAGQRVLAGVTTWGNPDDAVHTTSGQRVDANLAWIQPILANTPVQARCPRW